MFGIVFEVVRKKAKDKTPKTNGQILRNLPIRFTKLITARSTLDP
jgi:hypothetical protein